LDQGVLLGHLGGRRALADPEPLFGPVR
jgi:hypothetical protein